MITKYFKGGNNLTGTFVLMVNQNNSVSSIDIRIRGDDQILKEQPINAAQLVSFKAC